MGSFEVYYDERLAYGLHKCDTQFIYFRFNHKLQEDNKTVHLDVEGELDQVLFEVRMLLIGSEILFKSLHLILFDVVQSYILIFINFGRD